MIIGFAACDSSIYAGAYYAGRFSGDAAGTVNSSIVVKAGLDYYVRKFTGTRNRWGDYTGACIDPSDGTSFWIFNQYAMARSVTEPDSGRWATAYVKIPVGELPVELSSFSVSLVGLSFKLNWRTETETENYGFEIERKDGITALSAANNNDNGNIFEKIGFVQGNGNSNSPKEYSFTDNFVNGFLSYRLKQIDNDGTYSYSNIIKVEALTINDFAVYQNYPNPFNPITSIKFKVPAESKIRLTLTNSLGEEISSLLNEVKNPGIHEVLWDGSKYASGVYFANIQINSVDGKEGLNKTIKMILNK